MPVSWLITLIIAAGPHWGPQDCQEDPACERRNQTKATLVAALAEAILAGNEREQINDPVLLISVIAQESSFLTEPCERLIALDKIINRMPATDQRSEEYIQWKCGTRTCGRNAINIRESGDVLNFWVCSAGELGMMQLHPGGRWVRSGVTIPGTDIVLPRNPTERQRLILHPPNNIALGCWEMASHRASYLEHHEVETAHWLDWIGRYNSGRDGNDGYTRRIARRYRSICETPVEDDSTLRPLHEVWDGCAQVAEYLQ